MPVLSLVALLLYERTLCRCHDLLRHHPLILPPTHYRLDRSYQKNRGVLPSHICVLCSFAFDIVWLCHVCARCSVTWRNNHAPEGARALKNDNYIRHLGSNGIHVKITNITLGVSSNATLAVKARWAKMPGQHARAAEVLKKTELAFPRRAATTNKCARHRGRERQL